MNIPIPEVAECYGSIEEALSSVIRYCNVIVDKAKKVCPSNSVNDIPGYALEICRKILVQATTLVKVANERVDYNSTCSLVRILADNVSIINLVYCAEDVEEIKLRHLLYVRDGFSTRYNDLKNYPKPYDGKIPRETYDSLCAQVLASKDNALGCVEFCTNAIKNLSSYSAYQKYYDELVKHNNWKFKTIDKPKLQDAYKWNEMYKMLNNNSTYGMLSYFSQNVHGLSISNIILDDAEDFESPLCFAFCLIGWLFNYLRKVYEPYIEKYTWYDIRKMVPDWFINQWEASKHH